MDATAIVYALILLGYNGFAQDITSHDITSYHLTANDCIQEKSFQINRGRRETFNHVYFCMPVHDVEIHAQLDALNNAPNQIYRGTGGRIIIEIEIN